MRPWPHRDGLEGNESDKKIVIRDSGGREGQEQLSELLAKIAKRQAEQYQSKYAQPMAEVTAQVKNLAARCQQEGRNYQFLSAGNPCPTCHRPIPANMLPEVQTEIKKAADAILAEGKAKQAQLLELHLHLLPSSGAYSTGMKGSWADRAVHLILTLIVVVLSHLWYYAYLVRNKLLEEIRADYVILAKAKGLKKGNIFLRHCVRNLMPSYLSIMAVSVSHILGGTYMVETVFSYPGIGTLAYESARFHDYNLLMVLCILSGAAVIFCNIIAQAISERIDPRMKRNHEAENPGVTGLGA